ncbi:hypothetical protein HNR44_002048 [Geomicrobium halophilum]|uniref:Uncharacterized protein n=1 Tax=Geomicrobium halophilum TaxID=549000 RepID=A0A841PMT5_9BACL|nr:hypothetical protein [Geomicrobium halophilum]MBB6450070.1 hypothetical protein [Geomicrobium halophilum]
MEQTKMSEYNNYIAEKEKIDRYVNEGYRITDVSEDLSGALLTLMDKRGKSETLRIGNADARKYFSVLLLQQ